MQLCRYTYKGLRIQNEKKERSGVGRRQQTNQQQERTGHNLPNVKMLRHLECRIKASWKELGDLYKHHPYVKFQVASGKQK